MILYIFSRVVPAYCALFVVKYPFFVKYPFLVKSWVPAWRPNFFFKHICVRRLLLEFGACLVPLRCEVPLHKSITNQWTFIKINANHWKPEKIWKPMQFVIKAMKTNDHHYQRSWKGNENQLNSVKINTTNENYEIN